MKPVIVIRNYYENIYVTLGKSIEALKKEGLDLQADMLARRYPSCESFSQCMDLIQQYVDIVVEEDS